MSDAEGTDDGGVPADRSSRPFDVGLQPERTALAWRRTALALVVGAVVSIRVLPTLLGTWALVPAGAGIVLAVALLVASHKRYRRQHDLLTSADSDRIVLSDGRLPAAVTGTVLLGGIASLAVVLL